jgi:hypothetical protein
LRREGIYSSRLATWHKRRKAIERGGLEPKKRGCEAEADPIIAEARGLAELALENERLRRKLSQAHALIDVQKKPAPYSLKMLDSPPQGVS